MRKKSNIKRLLCALMASAMVLGLAACGGDGKQDGGDKQDAQTSQPAEPQKPDEAPAAPDVVAAGLEEGLVLNATGPATLRFLPPLICSKEDVDALVDKLGALL